MTNCKDWKPKFHHRLFCDLGNNCSKKQCSDCIHAKYVAPTLKELESIPSEDRGDMPCVSIGSD